MTANPLLSSIATGGGRMTEDRLLDYASWLNAKAWVRAYGWEYFVGKTEDGRLELGRRG